MILDADKGGKTDIGEVSVISSSTSSLSFKLSAMLDSLFKDSTVAESFGDRQGDQDRFFGVRSLGDPGLVCQNPLGELERISESSSDSNEASDKDLFLNSNPETSMLTSAIRDAAHSSHSLRSAKTSPASELLSEPDVCTDGGVGPSDGAPRAKTLASNEIELKPTLDTDFLIEVGNGAGTAVVGFSEESFSTSALDAAVWPHFSFSTAAVANSTACDVISSNFDFISPASSFLQHMRAIS
mmetsp:Transcript_3952/g.5780  ORF Transcript_3952/g.5780 Transcript_3952/m.5780 type:complete len:241 (+) Transcript_3952:914-1636(+)